LVPAPLSPSHVQHRQDSVNDRRRIFKQIIVKCVLQLLLIETTNDLLHNDEVYNTIPPEHLLQLMKVLDHSYQFARSFNADKELRTGLWKVGKYLGLPSCWFTILPFMIHRVHEAPSQPSETGVQQCSYSGQRSAKDVL